MFIRNGIVVKFNKNRASVRTYGGFPGMLIGTGMAVQHMVEELRKEGLPLPGKYVITAASIGKNTGRARIILPFM
jgi:hypothetical protein